MPSIEISHLADIISNETIKKVIYTVLIIVCCVGLAWVTISGCNIIWRPWRRVANRSPAYRQQIRLKRRVYLLQVASSKMQANPVQHRAAERSDITGLVNDFTTVVDNRKAVLEARAAMATGRYRLLLWWVPIVAAMWEGNVTDELVLEADELIGLVEDELKVV